MFFCRSLFPVVLHIKMILIIVSALRASTVTLRWPVLVSRHATTIPIVKNASRNCLPNVARHVPNRSLVRAEVNIFSITLRHTLCIGV